MEDPAYSGCRLPDISTASTGSFFLTNVFIIGLSISFYTKHKLVQNNEYAYLISYRWMHKSLAKILTIGF